MYDREPILFQNHLKVYKPKSFQDKYTNQLNICLFTDLLIEHKSKICINVMTKTTQLISLRHSFDQPR